MSRLLASSLLALTLLWVSAVAAATPLRPYEAPLLGAEASVPSLPPEYLQEDRGGVRFAYHPSTRDRVRVLLDDVDEAREELSRLLGRAVLSTFEVRVARGSADFERVVPDGSPRGSGVVAYGDRGLMVLSLSVSPSSTGTVRAAFRRGMAHLALDEVAGLEGLPRWLRVGFALHFSGEASLSRARALWWASMSRRLMPLADLDVFLADRAAHGSVAAAEAADMASFLLDREDSGQFAHMLDSVRRGLPLEEGLRGAYHQDLASLEEAWREDLAKHKAFAPVLVAGVGTWALLALVAHWRRRRRRRLAKVERARRVRPKRKIKLIRVAGGDDGTVERLVATELPEPEVPKVSHDGRWHTLH